MQINYLSQKCFFKRSFFLLPKSFWSRNSGWEDSLSREIPTGLSSTNERTLLALKYFIIFFLLEKGLFKQIQVLPATYSTFRKTTRKLKLFLLANLFLDWSCSHLWVKSAALFPQNGIRRRKRRMSESRLPRSKPRTPKTILTSWRTRRQRPTFQSSFSRTNIQKIKFKNFFSLFIIESAHNWRYVFSK